MQMDWRVTEVVPHTKEELCTNLRKVKLMGKNDEVEIYKNARIELGDLRLESDVYPVQNYVKLDELYKVRWLRARCKEVSGIDILNMDAYGRADIGYVTCMVEHPERDYEVDVLPPVIEHTIHEFKWVINDGMHRVYLGLVLEWMEMRGVYICDDHRKRELIREYPYYAYPRRDKWEGIEIIDGPIPENYVKKWHRYIEPDHKNYYRNFNSAFKAMSAPRKRG